MSAKTDAELNGLRNTYFTSAIRKGYIECDGYSMPELFGKIWKDIEDFEVYDDDVWVTSFPKCGTTWTQEMVWCICNNLDFEGAKVDLDYRFPFIEYVFNPILKIKSTKFSCVFDTVGMEYKPDIVEKSVQVAKNCKRPRFIKSHLPWELLPKQIRTFQKRPKIIHVARNPMDACVSFYHHSRFLEHYSGDFETFWQLFLKHKLSWTPYDRNIIGYWTKKDEPNILFIKFEDMKSNLPTVIDAVANFFAVELPEQSKQELLKHLSFDVMKNNKSVDHSILVEFLNRNDLILNKEGKFMRRKSGGYRSEMSEEVANIFTEVFVQKMEKEGLTF